MKFLMSHPQYPNQILVSVILGSTTQKLGSWVATDNKTGNQITSGLYQKDKTPNLQDWVYYCLGKIAC